MPLRRMSSRRMAPRRMSPRRRKAETEEADVPGTEGVLLLFFCNIVESLSGSYCLIIFEWCVLVRVEERIAEREKEHVLSWDILLIIELYEVSS